MFVLYDKSTAAKVEVTDFAGAGVDSFAESVMKYLSGFAPSEIRIASNDRNQVVVYIVESGAYTFRLPNQVVVVREIVFVR
jgi:hypothetical protein